ncbi:MAG: hypothetical protein IJ134_04685 [Bacilli bacterium]|nr:hypothetical protein [Bacilli bacterium]
MPENKEIENLLNNYKTMSDEQLIQLIIAIIKSEKKSLGINYPIIYGHGFDSKGDCEGDCTVNYNEKEKRDEITITLDYENIINNFLVNKNKENVASDNGLEALYTLIATLCHEMRHAYQISQMLKKNTTDYDALLWLKEKFVLTSISQDIYNNNHDNWSQENDAHSYMYDRALQYLNSYFSFNNISQLQRTSLMKMISSRKSMKVKPSNSLVIDVEGKKVSLEEFLNSQLEHIIPALPDVSLETILRYEYNSDRTKKTFKQLLDDKKRLISSLDKDDPNYVLEVQKIEKLYDSIINSDKRLALQQSQQAKTPQELYDEVLKKRAEFASSIESLMAIKDKYSEVEYNQRLMRLMQGRDAAQKQMDKYFKFVHTKSNFGLQNPTQDEDTIIHQKSSSKVERGHFDISPTLQEEVLRRNKELFENGFDLFDVEEPSVEEQVERKNIR